MAERLGRAGLLSLLGAGVGAVAGLLLSVVVGRAYGDAGAGVFFTVVAVFTIAANVLELGADTALVRQLARLGAVHQLGRARRTVLVAVLPVLVVGVAGVAVLWLVVPPLVGPDVETQLRRVLPLALAASLVAVLLGATRGLGHVLPFTLLWSVGLPTARLAAVLLVVAAGLGVGTAVWAWSLVVLPVLLASALTLRRALGHALGPETRPGPTPPDRRLPALRAEARELWAFSAPRGVAAALEILLSWLDVVLVAVLASPAAAGVYAVVSRAVTAGLLVDTAARVAVAPRISALLATGRVEAAARLQTVATRVMVLMAWPFYLTLAVFAPAVLGLFGPDFVRGSVAAAILSAAMMILVAAGMTQTLLLMGGRSVWQLGNKAVALTVLVVGDVLLVPRFGVEGAALAWAAAIAVDTGLAVRQVRRGIAVPIRWHDQLTAALLATVVVGGTAVAVALSVGRDLTGLGVHLLVTAPLYGGLLLVARHRLGLSAEDLREAVADRTAGTAS